MVICAAILAGVLAGTALADPNYVIRKDTDIGGFKLNDDATLRAAIDAYGTPTSRLPYEGQACIVVWSEFGIRITFSHVVSTTPCDGRGCHSETILTSSKWKTDKGLHVGDSLKRLRQVYRRAKLFISQRWTLISRPFAGTRLPTLLATINKGRIVAFVVRSPWLLSC
jgi:hypothetical protein